MTKLGYRNNLTRAGRYLYLDFIPTTFILPAVYNMFVEEYRCSITFIPGGEEADQILYQDSFSFFGNTKISIVSS